MSDTVEITLNNTQLRWYQDKGYEIPTVLVQLWAKNKNGERVKNGVEARVARGTKLVVKRSDLPPMSNKKLVFRCASCGNEYTTTWGAYRDKKSRDCKACVLARVKTTGCHSYWVDRLIVNDPRAKCDISGETDKRFLVLHHLLSRKSGGKNEASNYVILSANYHLAFHNWNGGMNVPSTLEQYNEFKRLELCKKKRPTCSPTTG